MNWTPEQLEDWQRKQMAPVLTESLAALAIPQPPRIETPILRAKAIPAHQKATGRLRLPKGMNKTEARYEAHLRIQHVMGAIAWYQFEGMKLKLADSTFFTPDFVVMLINGALQFHEVKARMSNGKPRYEDDAIVKLKVAAEQKPFAFFLVWPGKTTDWDNGEWESREF